MPYYDTIEEDLVRAKAILVEGKPSAGVIFGKDIYAAYKLLESFVAEIETLHSYRQRVKDLVLMVEEVLPDLFPDQQPKVQAAVDDVS